MRLGRVVCDPFMDEDRVLCRLRDEFKRYGKIIIAYDYDYTINNNQGEPYEYPALIQLLKDWRAYAHFICYSASPKNRFPTMRARLVELDVPLDFINENIPGVQVPQRAKIYYSILLDDRAGLGECVRILRRLLNEIKLDELKAKSSASPSVWYENIRDARMMLGLSQEELALKLGYESRSSISKIETGQADIPCSQIIHFAEALSMDPLDLMGWRNRQSPGVKEMELEVQKGYCLKNLYDAAEHASAEDILLATSLLKLTSRKK